MTYSNQAQRVYFYILLREDPMITHLPCFIVYKILKRLEIVDIWIKLITQPKFLNEWMNGSIYKFPKWKWLKLVNITFSEASI